MCRTCLFCVCLCIFIEFSLAKFVQLLNHFQNRPIDNPCPPPWLFACVCRRDRLPFRAPQNCIFTYLLIWLRTRRDEGGPKKKYIFKIDGWLNGKMSVRRFPLPHCSLHPVCPVLSCTLLCQFFSEIILGWFWDAHLKCQCRSAFD